jgi:hypothetical protein
MKFTILKTIFLINLILENIKKPLVLTNHSKYLRNLGYTKGKKGLSSYLRQTTSRNETK